MAKGKKRVNNAESADLSSKSMISGSEYSIETKVSEAILPEKLASMGIVDLRMTRPPKPVGLAGSKRIIDEDDTSGKMREQNKTQYQTLLNSSELVDEPPPPAKVRRVNAAALKA